MFLRSARMKKIPSSKKNAEQAKTVNARNAIGLAKSLTRISRTSSELGLPRSWPAEPCFREKLRRASESCDTPPVQIAKLAAVLHGHLPNASQTGAFASAIPEAPCRARTRSHSATLR